MARPTQTTLPLPLPPVVPRRPLYQVWPPRIESAESLDLVMAELARLKAWETRVAADAADKAAAVTREEAEQLVVEIDERDEPEPLTLADWRSMLEAAAEKFCNKYRDDLLEEGRKSKDLTHGRFGWRDQPAALQPLEDFPESGNDKILKGLLAELRKVLQNLADFTDGGARFVDVKVSWRKKELLKAFEDQDLSAKILKKAGFTIRDESEKFYIDPALGDVASQSSEKPK